MKQQLYTPTGTGLQHLKDMDSELAYTICGRKVSGGWRHGENISYPNECRKCGAAKEFVIAREEWTERKTEHEHRAKERQRASN